MGGYEQQSSVCESTRSVSGRVDESLRKETGSMNCPSKELGMILRQSRTSVLITGDRGFRSRESGMRSLEIGEDCPGGRWAETGMDDTSCIHTNKPCSIKFARHTPDVPDMPRWLAAG